MKLDMVTRPMKKGTELLPTMHHKKKSKKYYDMIPFEENVKYSPYGIYIGVHNDCFVFKTGQKDSAGLELCNFIGRFEEGLIESLIKK